MSGKYLSNVGIFEKSSEKPGCSSKCYDHRTMRGLSLLSHFRHFVQVISKKAPSLAGHHWC